MTLLEIAVPYSIKIILDDIKAVGAYSGLFKGVTLIALLYIGSELLNSLRIRTNTVLEQKVLLEMRRDLHSKLMRLSAHFYDQRKSGEISSRLIEDVTKVESALLNGTEQGLSAVLKIVGITAILFTMQPSLALCVFLPVPLLIICGIFYSKGSRIVWKEVRASAGELNSFLVENIQGNRLIKTFGIQHRESARFETHAKDLKSKTVKAMFRWSIYSPTTTLAMKLGLLGIVGIGGYLVLNNASDFSMSELLAFFLYAHMLYLPVAQLHGLNHLISAGRASGERVFEILDASIDVREPTQPKPLPDGPIEIAFKEVEFKYPERPAILKDLNLALEAGKVTALVGHTGAGKSTIANLAMRTYDVSKGSLQVNGEDIRNLSLNTLHQVIGHVAQDPFLFEGSIRSNLILSNPDATEDEIVRALEQSSAIDFVNALPNKLDTNIGEKGIRLSQGEKQRLTIARVFLKNSPFVILDEATASVDTITERKIQQALELLVKERTVLVIAHRLSTVRRADTIIVLKAGRIIESGSHQDLLAKGGYYTELCNHQSDQISESMLGA